MLFEPLIMDKVCALLQCVTDILILPIFVTRLHLKDKQSNSFDSKLIRNLLSIVFNYSTQSPAKLIMGVFSDMFFIASVMDSSICRDFWH